MAHRQRELPAADAAAGGTHFGLAKPTQRALKESRSSTAGMEYDAWAERIKSSYGGQRKVGAWACRPAVSRHGMRDGGGLDDEEFRLLVKRDGSESDTPSPPLWKGTAQTACSSRSVQNSPARDSGGSGGGRDDFLFSTTPRAQKIGRYRQEMMEMVRGAPEAAYELSLRDIVELPAIGQPEDEEKTAADKTESSKQRSQKQKPRTKRILRSASLDAGLLIKMFTPLSVRGGGGRGRAKSFGGSSSGASARVSPKPGAPPDGNRGGDEFSDSSNSRTNSSRRTSRMGSSSSSTASSSNTATSRNTSRKKSGCRFFFTINKRKLKREQAC